MKRRMKKAQLESSPETGGSEILILSDSRIFAHNLTPALAEVLLNLNPEDEVMSMRANQNTIKNELPN